MNALVGRTTRCIILARSFAFRGTATARIRCRLLSLQQAYIRTQLHPAHPCKRCTPALPGFVTAAVLRSLRHGSSLHPQPVALAAASLHSQPAAHAHPCKRRTPALKGFVTAAVLRCSWHGNSQHSLPVASGAASLHPHPAAHCSAHSAALRLEGLRLRSHAFAVSITATACIRSQLHLVQQACIRTQLHLAHSAVRCPQVVQPPSATCR